MTAGTERKYLVFTVMGALYALDLEQVAEVITPPQLSPLPLAPDCYSGVLNFHGEIIAVLDLSLFLGFAATVRPEKIVVLHSTAAALAFLVEAVLKVVSVTDTALHPSPDSRSGVSTINLPEGSATLLNLETVVTEAANRLKGHGHYYHF